MRRTSRLSPLLILAFVGCSGAREDDGGASAALVAANDIQCSIPRGGFVEKGAGGVRVSCSGARAVSVNGVAANDEGAGFFTFLPTDGLNIMHVEALEDGGRPRTYRSCTGTLDAGDVIPTPSSCASARRRSNRCDAPLPRRDAADLLADRDAGAPRSQPSSRASTA